MFSLVCSCMHVHCAAVRCVVKGMFATYSVPPPTRRTAVSCSPNKPVAALRCGGSSPFATQHNSGVGLRGSSWEHATALT